MRAGTFVVWQVWPEEPSIATLAKITAIADDMVHMDLLACTGKTWKQAVFKKVFVDKDGKNPDDWYIQREREIHNQREGRPHKRNRPFGSGSHGNQRNKQRR